MNANLATVLTVGLLCWMFVWGIIAQVDGFSFTRGVVNSILYPLIFTAIVAGIRWGWGMVL